jgi:CheY-like chemotaxis protein
MPGSNSAVLHDRRIMVVDDEDDWRDSLSSILTACGARIVPCRSAIEALYQLEQLPFDVVVSDIHMPYVDGWALIAAVRASQHAHIRRTPTAAMSSRDDPQFRLRATTSGFDVFIPKHASLSSMLHSIELICGRR